MKKILFVVVLLFCLGLVGCAKTPETTLEEYCDNQTQYCEYDGFSRTSFCREFVREQLRGIDNLDANGESDCADAYLEYFECGGTASECVANGQGDSCTEEYNEYRSVCILF